MLNSQWNIKNMKEIKAFLTKIYNINWALKDDNEILIKLTDFLILSDLCKSKSEGDRLIKQKGIKVNDELMIEDCYIGDQSIVKKGKRHFVKLVI